MLLLIEVLSRFTDWLLHLGQYMCPQPCKHQPAQALLRSEAPVMLPSPKEPVSTGCFAGLLMIMGQRAASADCPHSMARDPGYPGRICYDFIALKRARRVLLLKILVEIFYVD